MFNKMTLFSKLRAKNYQVYKGSCISGLSFPFKHIGVETPTKQS